jgi:dipeptidyl aminopeptidase/acylaminoacyl peptidase
VARGKPLPRFEQFVAQRRFQPAITFSPDGRRVLFVTDISGQFNLWRCSVRGGWPEQLTSFQDNSVRSVTVSPDGSTIVFTADEQGDEFHQIYALPARGGWPEQWTDSPEVQHFLDQECWSPDGETLAYAANARTPTDMDVWLRDAASGETRNLFGGDKFAFPTSWSPDGARLLVTDMRSNSDQTLWLVDVESGDARELTPHDNEVEEVRWLPGPWSRDGSGFYVRTDRGREQLGLAFFRLEAQDIEWIDTPEGDVELVSGSGDGRVLAYAVNERGWSRLELRDLDRGEPLPSPKLPRGALWFDPILALSHDGKHAATHWHSATGGGELYVIETASGRTRRLVDSLIGGLRPRDLVEPELISFPSFDREIDAWLYRPKRRGRTPVVLAIHGGPESQERPWYNPLFQYLLSRGIAVLAPNVRGSTGYGKTFQKLIHHDWGGAELRDLEYAARWLQDEQWVDAERLGVYGGSFGGFATLSCVTRLPDYWAAAVDIVGPSNLVTFAKAVPPTWRRFMARWVGDPDTEQEFLMERSPITYVDQVRAPLLVIQGAHDPRVVQGESDQMVQRLRDLDKDVEYVVFEDEGHGFTKRENQIRAVRLSAEWFESRLLAEERPKLRVVPVGVEV